METCIKFSAEARSFPQKRIHTSIAPNQNSVSFSPNFLCFHHYWSGFRGIINIEIRVLLLKETHGFVPILPAPLSRKCAGFPTLRRRARGEPRSAQPAGSSACADGQPFARTRSSFTQNHRRRLKLGPPAEAFSDASLSNSEASTSPSTEYHARLMSVLISSGSIPFSQRCFEIRNMARFFHIDGCDSSPILTLNRVKSTLLTRA